MATGAFTGSADPAELARFQAMAAEWWDPNGKFRPLHMMNPCRLDYAVRQIAAEHGRDLTVRKPFDGLAILDIGCGGGLMSEPMARLGASVTGVDAAPGTIPVAELHAREAGLDIDYREGTAEELAAEGLAFDAILNLEVIEHVADKGAFVHQLQERLADGGLMMISTPNRTARSKLLLVEGAERLGMVPRGTHHWQDFVTPEELRELLAAAGLSDA